MILTRKAKPAEGEMRKRSLKHQSVFLPVMTVLLTVVMLFTGLAYPAMKTGHPLIVSESRVDMDGDGLKEIIQIVLEKGRRYQDKTPWCGNGEKWEGMFTIRIIKGERVVTRQSLNALMNPDAPEEDLFFWTPRFSLSFADYNGDGMIDFNLGQYGSCNGNLYRLYTISTDGIITRLPVDGAEGFFISGQGKRNSSGAIKTRDGKTSFAYYDNTFGKTVRAYYQWNGRSFVRLEEKGGAK